MMRSRTRDGGLEAGTGRKRDRGVRGRRGGWRGRVLAPGVTYPPTGARGEGSGLASAALPLLSAHSHLYPSNVLLPSCLHHLLLVSLTPIVACSPASLVPPHSRQLYAYIRCLGVGDPFRTPVPNLESA
ncbi:hypothetical protein VTO73DRAFT_983 [Trametes versicolor]